MRLDPPYKRPDAVKEAWGEWIAGMGDWHVFGGLTYDQRRRTSVPGSDVARAHVRRWLRSFGRDSSPRVEAAVVALEYHKSGWPHFHPLLRLSGGAGAGDFARLGQAWYAAHGYARLEAPRRASDVAEYAAKYLSKDLSRGDVIFWPSRGPLTTHQPSVLRGAPRALGRLPAPARAAHGSIGRAVRHLEGSTDRPRVGAGGRMLSASWGELS